MFTHTKYSKTFFAKLCYFLVLFVRHKQKNRPNLVFWAANGHHLKQNQGKVRLSYFGCDVKKIWRFMG